MFVGVKIKKKIKKKIYQIRPQTRCPKTQDSPHFYFSPLTKEFQVVVEEKVPHDQPHFNKF